VLAALLLTVAVGCGSSGGGGSGGSRLSKSQYEKKVQAEGSKIKAAFRSASAAGAGDFDTLAKNVEKGQKELRAAADRLGQVNPPKEIENAHNQLVDAMHGLADALDPFISALKAHDVKKIQKTAQDISKSPAVAKAQKAVNEMKKKGYDLGDLGT
jgi:hypothetical protein